MELKITGKNASGHVTTFNEMKLDRKNQYVEGSDDKTRDFVRDLPRIEPYTGANNVRVLHEGKEYTLSFKFYTDKEKEVYKTYRDDHKGTGGSSKTTKRSEEDYNAGLEALENMKKVGASKEVLDLMEAFVNRLKPVDPAVAKARALLDSLTPEQKKLLGLPC